MERKKMRRWVFSHSQLQNSDCSNKRFIRQDLKLRSKRYSRTKNLIQGKIFAAGLDILYKSSKSDLSIETLTEGKLLDKALNHCRALVLQAREELVPEDGETREMFERKLDVDLGLPLVMLEGYYRYIFMYEQYEVVETEKELRARILTPSGRKSPNMWYLSYLDQIIRNIAGDGRQYLHEIKTAAQWSDKNELYLKIDPQTTGYLWNAQQNKLDLEGTIYTVCLKTSSRPNLTDDAKKKKREEKKKFVAEYISNYPEEEAVPRKAEAAKKFEAAYQYDPIADYESPGEYLQRIREEYLSRPEKYYVRRIFQRTRAQIDQFERDLYVKCCRAKEIASMPPVPEPSLQKCSMCDGFDLCQLGIPLDSIKLDKNSDNAQLLDAHIEKWYRQRDRVSGKEDYREEVNIEIEF